MPDPLALTSAQFADLWRAQGRPGGALAALDAYAHTWRSGAIAGAASALAPLTRTHLSDSPEGAVLKFCQRVPRTLPRPSPIAPASRTDSPSTPSHAGARSLSLVPEPHAPDLEIESVLIPMIGKKRSRSYTLCVSSQVGCSMNCGFCQTAQMGLIRSLAPAEIVAQWALARWRAPRPDPLAPIRNIVFMGMGEPLDNLDNVIHAIAILTDQRGPSVPMSRITVSTVGHVPNLERLAHQVRTPGWHRLNLAVSLNAPTDAIRASIMPVNRTWPLARLREVLVAWPLYAGTHLCLEYVLIPGVNDNPACAAALASFVLGDEFPAPDSTTPPDPFHPPRYHAPRLTAMVNVIPYNPRLNSPWPAPTEAHAEHFMAQVAAFGVFVKRRRTKGRDTMAACGQLGNPEITRAAMRKHASAHRAE